MKAELYTRFENFDERANGLTYFDGVTADGAVEALCLPRKLARKLERSQPGAEQSAPQQEETAE